jgi:hypothetical protein
VIAAAEVAKNVFVATDIPEVPISAIVARDADGHEVWRESHGR